MSILLMCGEDSDFAGVIPYVSTGGGRYRSEYARCSLTYPDSTAGDMVNLAASPSFGSKTDVWVSFRMFLNVSFNNTARFFSLTQGGAERVSLKSKGSGSVSSDVVLTDGTTDTVLGAISTPPGAVIKYDLHVVYGVSGSVTVYRDGTQVLAWTGDTTRGGSTALDGFAFGRGSATYFSEFIVADEDTRLFNLKRLELTGAGDTNGMSGVYGDVNETTLSDATVLSTDTLGVDAQFALSDLPAGLFTVRAVGVTVRASHSAGSTATGLQLGVKTGGVVNLGAAQTADVVWSPMRRIMLQNPVTGNVWQSADVNALQLALRSA